MNIDERVSQLAENYTHLMGGLCDCEDKIQAMEERLEERIIALEGSVPTRCFEEDKDSLARLILTPNTWGRYALDTTKSNSHFIMPEER